MKAALISPTYYVRHPDESISVADPQPVVARIEAGAEISLRIGQRVRHHDYKGQLTSELLDEVPARTGRHRPLNTAYRTALHRRPTYTCSAVALLSVVCAVIWVVR